MSAPKTALFLSLLFAIAVGPARAEIGLEDLLDQMTDLERLTTTPDPYYTTRQFSSWDRRSTDASMLTDENWFGNWDRGRYLRKEEQDGETVYVLMDAEGPGAIVRMWSANPADAGNIRIYIDGAETPTLDLPLTQWLGGEHPLAPEPIGGVRGQGWNNYLPIPYAASVKVVSTEWDFYYHINYRTYEAGTAVESFTVADADAARDRIESVAKALAAPEQAAAMPSKTWQARNEFDLGGNASGSCVHAKGPAAVYAFTGRVEADDLAAALRGTWLEISFDGNATVEAPLGDFFGTAPGANQFHALPCGMNEDGSFYSHWVMPYREQMEMRLTSHGGQPVHIETRFETGARDWTGDSLYFHAKFKGERDIPTQPRRDWTYLEVDGAGRFAGVMLHVANPVADWWGEGDEKIYLDSEEFPSTFGTGTEDYYGYAWCSTQLFTHAYHNQPRCDGPNNYGHTSVNRFHIIDDMPFREHFKFDMEVWHWADTTVDQSVVAYWYATAESTDAMPEVDEALLTIPEVPELKKLMVEGAIEAESLEVKEITGGSRDVQTSYAWPWSNAAQAWWRKGRPGDTLTLAFPAGTAGPHKVYARFTTARDYGVASFEVNGGPAGGKMDFYTPNVEVGDEVLLGTFNLKEEGNTFTVRLAGKNPEAEPAYMVGIDYLRVEPVR